MTQEQEIAAQLAALADGDSLVRDATHPRDGVVRPARFGGLVAERRGPVLPYVQALRIGDVLVVEASGSVQIGGTVPLSDAEHEQLLALGWAVPDGGVANYRGQYPVTAYADVARLWTRTLAVLDPGATTA